VGSSGQRRARVSVLKMSAQESSEGALLLSQFQSRTTDKGVKDCSRGASHQRTGMEVFEQFKQQSQQQQQQQHFNFQQPQVMVPLSFFQHHFQSGGYVLMPHFDQKQQEGQQQQQQQHPMFYQASAMVPAPLSNVSNSASNSAASSSSSSPEYNTHDNGAVNNLLSMRIGATTSSTSGSRTASEEKKSMRNPKQESVNGGSMFRPHVSAFLQQMGKDYTEPLDARRFCQHLGPPLQQHKFMTHSHFSPGAQVIPLYDRASPCSPYVLLGHHVATSASRSASSQGRKKSNQYEDPRPQGKRRCKDSSSKFRGVSWHRRDRKWLARTWINGRIEHLGCYRVEEMAALAVDLRKIEHFGETRKGLNFSDPKEREELREYFISTGEFKIRSADDLNRDREKSQTNRQNSKPAVELTASDEEVDAEEEEEEEEEHEQQSQKKRKIELHEHGEDSSAGSTVGKITSVESLDSEQSKKNSLKSSERSASSPIPAISREVSYSSDSSSAKIKNASVTTGTISTPFSS